MPYDRVATTWTSAQVLSDVRRKASLPATSTDWTDAVILREATDVLWSFTGWALAQAGEGRLLTSLDRPVTSVLTGAYGAREFVLPPLAVASTIESVTWTDATGRTQSRLTRLDHGEEPDWSTPQGQGSPSTYTLIGDRIRLYPLASSGGTVRITYQRRHPELVVDAVTNVGAISAIVTATATSVTVTHNMSGAPAVGDMVDIISSSYPYAPLVAGAEVTATPVPTSAVVAVPLAQVLGLDTGTRLVKAGQSPYVSLPLELRTCLAEKVAANILRTLGDLQGMAAAEQSATLELSRVMQLLSPRAKRDKPYAINPYSHLRMRMTRGRW